MIGALDFWLRNLIKERSAASRRREFFEYDSNSVIKIPEITLKQVSILEIYLQCDFY